jgi:hypothetical protein
MNEILFLGKEFIIKLCKTNNTNNNENNIKKEIINNKSKNLKG